MLGAAPQTPKCRGRASTPPHPLAEGLIVLILESSWERGRLLCFAVEY
jgi:hypothetical protein